jgi:hypothetical protein
LERSLSPPPAGSTGTRLLTFHARAADQDHVAYVPDATRPISEHPPGSSRSTPHTPRFRRHFDFDNDTSPAISTFETAHRLPDPHLTHPAAPFPCRSPRRSSANAAHGGLEPPPAGRLRRAHPSSLAQHRIKEPRLHHQFLSAFVTHVGLNNVGRVATRHWRSGGVTVFVDQPAENVCSLDHASLAGWAYNLARDRRSLIESAMRAVSVVVGLVLVQNPDKLPLIEDQQAVQALATDRADPHRSA